MSRLLGTAPCTGPNCKETVAVNETGGGFLSCKCQICKWSAFAPPGTRSARNLRTIMTAIDDPEDLNPTDPKPQDPTPPKKAVNSAFNLGDLS